jgi:ubiquinone/menaquinone biosynthesis C-methylase UbiE
MLFTSTVHSFFWDESDRRRWQNPEAILTDIGLKPGFTFIDVGCGNGFFTLPAARLVGEKGKVYGIDVNAEAIEMLKKKAMKEGLQNLNLRVGIAEETILCHACADIVFFGIVLHDFKDASRVLSNAKRMIKSKGKLVDLDWKKKPMNSGPPLRIRFSEEKAASLIEAAGFKINSVRNAGPHHYLIIAK